MNYETYNHLIQNPKSLDLEHISDLRSTINEFPYFQSARALYLKGLKNGDSFRYNSELKITAAHTTDRTVLFDYITSSVFKEKSNQLGNISSILESQAELKSQEEVELDLGSPINFSIKEKHSFHEWLQLSVHNPIIREKKQETEKETKQNIIDKFIKTNPKIVPVEKTQDVGLSISKNKTDKSLMTETLAKVYLEQNKYSKAIKAYEILSLKYPEKSGFFADQIKRIKILKQKKS